MSPSPQEIKAPTLRKRLLSHVLSTTKGPPPSLKLMMGSLTISPRKIRMPCRSSISSSASVIKRSSQCMKRRTPCSQSPKSALSTATHLRGSTMRPKMATCCRFSESAARKAQNPKISINLKMPKSQPLFSNMGYFAPLTAFCATKTTP